MTAQNDSFRSRRRFSRQRWKLNQDELADRAGIGVATIRRAEGGKFDPRLSTATKLADALHVRVEWLLTGDLDIMLSLDQMTVDEQFAVHTGPGTEGLPGFVVIDPGGPWYRDDDDEWQVDPSY